jgi:hypothetical protein
MSNALYTENHEKNVEDNSEFSNVQIQRELVETQESSKFDNVWIDVIENSKEWNEFSN